MFPVEADGEGVSERGGALDEIRNGSKRSHWMWFIFSQLAGLGRSETARFFGVRSIGEARGYTAHPLLGKRYFECVAALQGLASSDPVAVLGKVDAMKLKSPLTLFEAAGASPLLAAAIDRWFGGARDEARLGRIRGQ